MAKACPKCGGSLSRTDDGLFAVCNRCSHRYKLKNPVPVQQPAYDEDEDENDGYQDDYQDDYQDNYKPKKSRRQSNVSDNGGGFFKEDYGTGMSVLNWLLTYLLMCIPIANIVFIIKWAFIDPPESEPVRKNFARSQIVMFAIMIILEIIIFAIAGAAIGTLFKGLG